MNKSPTSKLLFLLVLLLPACASDDRPFYQIQAEVDQANADADRYSSCVRLEKNIRADSVQGIKYWKERNLKGYRETMSHAASLCEKFYSFDYRSTLYLWRSCTAFLKNREEEAYKQPKDFCDRASAEAKASKR